ncbi:MAG: Ldh family oxidoreductase [Chloroflexi bacterium]|nr:Ldh family oxidoreductase [Chloroflexota bacterium]
MPTVTADALRRIGYDFFAAVGCRPADARIVTDHLVQSNLFGHDSHGVVHMERYGRAVWEEQRVDPRAVPDIVREYPCTAVVDANGGFGQVGATFATNLLIQKAQQYGVASVSLRDTSHIGRLSAYPLMVAQAGMIGLIFVNAGRMGFQVAPFGGIDGRLGTNPLAFASPRRADTPLFVDMSTSTVADGKIYIAANQGKPVPEGWFVDAEGNPSTNPHDYFGEPRGAVLPLGGPLGHKGFALSLMMEICGGGMSGQGMSQGDMRFSSNGVLITAYDIAQFTDPEAFYAEVEALVSHVKSSRTAPGVDEILVPGEPEFRTERERGQTGIPIDDTTWEKLCAAARELGLEPDTWELASRDAAD